MIGVVSISPTASVLRLWVGHNGAMTKGLALILQVNLDQAHGTTSVPSFAAVSLVPRLLPSLSPSVDVPQIRVGN